MDDIVEWLYYHHLEYRQRLTWDYGWKICTQNGTTFNNLTYIELDFLNEYGIRSSDE
jgi:hypothetical protein